MIRRNIWCHIFETYPELSSQLKSRILQSYFYDIKIKVMKDKKQYLQKLKNRCDIHQILSLTEVNAARENKFFVKNIDQQYQSHYHIHMNIQKMIN